MTSFQKSIVFDDEIAYAVAPPIERRLEELKENRYNRDLVYDFGEVEAALTHQTAPEPVKAKPQNSDIKETKPTPAE